MLVFRFVQVDNRKGYIPDPLDITFGGVLNCWWVCSFESHKFPFNWTLEDTPTTYPTHPYTLDRLSHRGWWEFERPLEQHHTPCFPIKNLTSPQK